MGKVVVFDSGFGSLSIISAIRKITKAEIIYFADQKNYPYGKKTNKELYKIIKFTIDSLKKQFQPDVIVVGSNTPTLLFPDLFAQSRTIMGVLPPLAEAQKKTKTKSIAILGTAATIHSKKTDQFIQNNLKKNILVYKINASELIDLVESGKFIYDKRYCQKIIIKVLAKTFDQQNIDVATLSSTHLPFLLPTLKKLFSQITFLDPAMQVATSLAANKQFIQSKRNSLQIFSSSNPKTFESHLRRMKIQNKVQHLEF